MKTSVALVVGITSCLISGVSTYAWSGDLDSALENVTISTDAQNHAKHKNDTNNLPCNNKTTSANCPTAADDTANTTAYQALMLQQTISDSTRANVTINGTQSPVGGQQPNVLVQGF